LRFSLLFFLMNEVSLLVAFGAGVISFFSPCIVPLLPVYLIFLGGTSFEKIRPVGKWHLYLGVLLFTLTLSSIFFIQGFLAGSLGYILFRFKRELEIAFGVLIAFLGFFMTGIIRFPFLMKERRVSLGDKIKGVSPLLLGPILGFAFSLTWTPCSGPVLASILALAASSGAPLRGGMLLFLYSLGFSLPFILIALFFTGLARLLVQKMFFFRYLQIVSGFLFMALGVLLALGIFSRLFY